MRKIRRISLCVSFITIYLAGIFTGKMQNDKTQEHTVLEETAEQTEERISAAYPAILKADEEMQPNIPEPAGSFTVLSDPQMPADLQEPSEQRHTYYLVASDDHIIIYQDNLDQIYQVTGIALYSLPETLQKKITEVMVISDEQMLFDFLETYTS